MHVVIESFQNIFQKIIRKKITNILSKMETLPVTSDIIYIHFLYAFQYYSNAKEYIYFFTHCEIKRYEKAICQRFLNQRSCNNHIPDKEDTQEMEYSMRLLGKKMETTNYQFCSSKF